MKRYYQKSNGGFIEHKDGDWIKAQDCRCEEYRTALDEIRRKFGTDLINDALQDRKGKEGKQ